MRLPTKDELLTSIMAAMEVTKRNLDKIEGEWSEYHEQLEQIDNRAWDLARGLDD